MGEHSTDEYGHYFFKLKEKAEEFLKKNPDGYQIGSMELQEILFEDDKYCACGVEISKDEVCCSKCEVLQI